MNEDPTKVDTIPRPDINSDMEPTKEEQELMKTLDQREMTFIENMNKVGKKWKYKFHDIKDDKTVIVQTQIEPRDLPVTFKYRKDYCIPFLPVKGRERFRNIADRFVELIYVLPDEADIISSVSDDKLIDDGCDFQKTPSNESQSLTEQSPAEEQRKLMLKDKPQDEFQIMDKRDEQQILAEIKGHMIEEYVYEFEVDIKKNGIVVGKRKVTGVSYSGVKALVSRRGGYAIEQSTIVENNGIWYAKVKIQDKIMDIQGLGLGECSLQETFARQKAMSKALRNAYRSIMDEGQFIAFIKEWKERNK